jgi:hypothetical protein
MDITRIYLVTNCYEDPNKVYIGKTKNSRHQQHKRTYGKNIEYTYIDEIYSLDHKEWKPLECYWIEQFRQWGFELMNINKKGGQGPGIYSEESKNKMRKPRPGSGIKISRTLRLNNHPQYYTDEVKEKISKGNKGIPRPFTEEHRHNMEVAKRKQAKTVLMFDLENNIIQEWESKGQAAKWIQETKGRQGNLTSQIKDAIFGRQKTAFGYKWKYK